MRRFDPRTVRGARLVVAVYLALGLGACGRPALAARDARVVELERREASLLADQERDRALITTLQGSSEEILANLEMARSAQAQAEAERDQLRVELVAAQERGRELEDARAGTSSELSRMRETASEARSRVAELEEELEAAKGRERQLRRRVETLRVCCQTDEP